MSNSSEPTILAADQDLALRFWGVRGSTPVSGPQYAEFGGSTPCIEVRCGQRMFIVDAGSGIYNLGQGHRTDLPQEVDLLFSHLHLDHTAGLPFFKPAVLDPDRVINTYCGNLGGESAGPTLDRLFAPPLFPVTLDKLCCTFHHHGFEAGQTLAFPDGTRVATIMLNHPQGSVGYRFEHGGRRLCLISDIEHSDPWPDPELVRLRRRRRPDGLRRHVHRRGVSDLPGLGPLDLAEGRGARPERRASRRSGSSTCTRPIQTRRCATWRPTSRPRCRRRSSRASGRA